MNAIYGIHAVMAKIRHHPETLRAVYLVKGAEGNKKNQESSLSPRLTALESAAKEKGVKVHFVAKNRLDGWFGKVINHQGVIAECDKNSATPTDTYLSLQDLLQDTEGAPVTLLALDQVHDPHNLGACLRSCDAFGAKAIIIPKDRSATMTEAVSRSAAGAAETVPLITVPNLARALDDIADARIVVVGLAGEATESIWKYQPDARICWVLGGEENGLRRLTREKCQRLLSIPMQGSVESLNVSVTAALCLAESARSKSK